MTTMNLNILKGYVFVNSYMKGIQAGIQASHALVALSLKNCPNYEAWAKHYETLVLLEGGSHNQMFGNLGKLKEIKPDVSTGIFFEGAMNDALTAFAFVPDMDVHDIAFKIREYRKTRWCTPTEFDAYCIKKWGNSNYELAEWLMGFRTHAG